MFWCINKEWTCAVPSNLHLSQMTARGLSLSFIKWHIGIQNVYVCQVKGYSLMIVLTVEKCQSVLVCVSRTESPLSSISHVNSSHRDSSVWTHLVPEESSWFVMHALGTAFNSICDQKKTKKQCMPHSVYSEAEAPGSCKFVWTLVKEK